LAKWSNTKSSSPAPSPKNGKPSFFEEGVLQATNAFRMLYGSVEGTLLQNRMVFAIMEAIAAVTIGRRVSSFCRNRRPGMRI
jgi:hypothetical protein